jgi:hypothetical protein
LRDSVSDIVVSAGMDISHLRRNAKEGAGHLRRFGRDTEQVNQKMIAMGRFAATAGAAVVAGLGAAAAAGANAAREIQNLAKIADTSVENFQALAFGARSVGIEQEKFADILRDVQDRVGDFLSTGAGPMADFFENIAPVVGVTADQFARLSGPEALQLYVSSLEAANLNQQEMTFYLEAMASDASALLPLLKENGAAMASYADEARELGVVLGGDTIQRAADARQTFDELGATLSAAGIEIAATLAPTIEHLAGLLVGLVRWIDDAAAAVRNFVNPQTDLEIATDNVVAAMGDEIRQSQLLSRALGISNTMSVEAARAALQEANARHKNVQAIIAERRALAVGSDEFQTLTDQIAGAQDGLRGIGFPSQDAASALKADAFERQQQSIVDLINKRQELLRVDEEMNAQ